MFVRKFEADTIEEALKDIKRELGPDAVILKTITNKGIKGAFKKNKIEITAAISEKNYTKKAHVDQVLNTDQKTEFYNGSAGYISNMIDQHDSIKESSENRNKNNMASNGYGSLGLNKTVASTKNVASSIKNGLDDFLSLGEKEDIRPRSMDFDFDAEMVGNKPQKMSKQAQVQPKRKEESYLRPSEGYQALDEDPLFLKQKNKIDELEKKLFELTRNFEKFQKKEPIGIYQLRTTLRSLDINEAYIQELIKKGLFELTDIDAENADVVFEFALREMMSSIQTDLPLFSREDNQKIPTVTIFVSEASCGQSLMVQKVAALKKDSVIIRNNYTVVGNQKTNFSEKIFDLNIIKTSTIAEMVSECRKSIEAGRSVFIDYNCIEAESNETKKFIDGIRRAFAKVEVLITLSAIHTELYNRKIISTYKRIADGLVVTHLDACLNFGGLFNISWDMKDLPYKFFGTGEVVPNDLESASPERLMAGIFKLN